MQKFLSALFLISIFSCVSKKKYNEKITELTVAENRIHFLKEDSIANQKHIQCLLKDSAEMHAKYAELKKQKETSTPSVIYFKQTISEEKEYDLKMVFIYNISAGTEWEYEYKKGDFVIGVLGKSKISEKMKVGLANKKKSGQAFAVVEYNSVSEIKNCHLLFITKTFYGQLSAIKNKIAKYPTLFVSEEDYSNTLAHFNLAVDGDELKMFANKETIKKASFKVSKNLLNMSAN